MRRLVVLGVSVLAPFMVVACKQEKPPAAPQAMPVKVGAPVTKKLSEWDQFTGRFKAKDRVEIRARVSGYLSEVRFTDGQRVKQGDVLFVIDQRPFRIALDRAEAALALTKSNYDRSKLLVASHAVSKQDLETQLQAYRTAKADVESARLNLEFTEVRSPVSGRVSRHKVDVGNLVNGSDFGSTLLTTVVSEDPIYFYFEASETDVLKYMHLDQAGQRESSRTNHRPLYVKLQDEKDFTHEGKMDFVDNEIDSDTGTLQARAVFPNPDGRIIPGIFGRAKLAGSGEYVATLVPDDVIGTNQTQKFVYVVSADNVLEPHPVTLGPLYDGGLRIIRDGLKPDDKVVMTGITMLRPGMKVSPEPYEAPAPSAAPGAAPAASATSAKPAVSTPGHDVDADDESDGTDAASAKKEKKE